MRRTKRKCRKRNKFPAIVEREEEENEKKEEEVKKGGRIKESF